MPTDHGAFEMYGFESSLTKEEIVVLAKGTTCHRECAYSFCMFNR